jgi:hypothetical protein
MEGERGTGLGRGEAWGSEGGAEAARKAAGGQLAVVHHLRLVHLEDAANDVIRVVRELFTEAESGTVVGLAFVALHRDRSHSRHACGEAFEDPIYSSGLVGLLRLDLEMQAREA